MLALEKYEKIISLFSRQPENKDSKKIKLYFMFLDM